MSELLARCEDHIASFESSKDKATEFFRLVGLGLVRSGEMNGVIDHTIFEGLRTEDIDPKMVAALYDEFKLEAQEMTLCLKPSLTRSTIVKYSPFTAAETTWFYEQVPDCASGHFLASKVSGSLFLCNFVEQRGFVNLNNHHLIGRTVRSILAYTNYPDLTQTVVLPNCLISVPISLVTLTQGQIPTRPVVGGCVEFSLVCDLKPPSNKLHQLGLNNVEVVLEAIGYANVFGDASDWTVFEGAGDQTGLFVPIFDETQELAIERTIRNFDAKEVTATDS